ncbi:hypothetical protein JCM10212_000441 [Sporobolomyces blumeae]
MTFSTLLSLALLGAPVRSGSVTGFEPAPATSTTSAAVVPEQVDTTASTTTSPRIIVPLYSWNEECWPDLQRTAESHPDVPYLIILNPNSGPTSDVSDPSLYCVPFLRSILPRSSLVVGYVRTGYGSRSLDDVRDDVETYAGWEGIVVSEGTDRRAPFVGGGAGLDGIFFDETDWQEADERLEAFRDAADAGGFGAGTNGTKVVFNPGTKVSDSYFDHADLVVAYESSFVDYDPSSLPTDPLLRQKSIVMIHDLPASSSSSSSSSSPLSDVLSPLIGSSLSTSPTTGGGGGQQAGEGNVVDARIAAVFVTDLEIEHEDVYAQFGSNWDDFVQAVGQA